MPTTPRYGILPWSLFRLLAQLPVPLVLIALPQEAASSQLSLSITSVYFMGLGLHR